VDPFGIFQGSKLFVDGCFKATDTDGLYLTVFIVDMDESVSAFNSLNSLMIAHRICHQLMDVWRQVVVSQGSSARQYRNPPSKYLKHPGIYQG
jgi:hypothetical protein